MRAVRVNEVGGGDKLVLEEVPQPDPGPGQVLVAIAAAGVNFVETYHRSGLYRRPLPFTVGSEGAGRIVAVGPDVEAGLVGARVASTSFEGSYAEAALAPADFVALVPDAIDDEVAAGTLLQGMTAHYLLHDTYPAQPGETVLVHAGAGGMGLLLTQMAARMGVRVIATVSTPAKADLSRQAGAVEVIGYADVPARVRELTGGEGVAAVYDGVGRSTFDASLASLRRHGVLVSYGNASGPVPPVDPLRLSTAGSVYLIRPTLAHYVATPEEFQARADAVLSAVAAGELDILIGARYPLAEAGRAQEDLEARRTTGKLVLVP